MDLDNYGLDLDNYELDLEFEFFCQVWYQKVSMGVNFTICLLLQIRMGRKLQIGHCIYSHKIKWLRVARCRIQHLLLDQGRSNSILC